MTDLRADIICEKTRSTGEIRTTLARLIKHIRKHPGGIEAEAMIGQIDALRWVLRQDITPQAYYQETYKRDYPNA